ncbi:MAG: transcriptional regulator, HxlR family [Subtercola sp.]|nr:transcriptional regulator, HxlR family [Subtercola sp.]
MHEPIDPVFLSDCPARLVMEILSDKWAPLVIYGLSRQPRRHGELVDLVGGVSRKVLTDTLRRLQGYGLVERLENAPRHIHYRLTDLGQTLVDPIEILNDWASDHADAITEFGEAQTGAVRHAPADGVARGFS